MRMAKNVLAVCLSAEIFLAVGTAFCLAFCWEKEKNAIDKSEQKETCASNAHKCAQTRAQQRVFQHAFAQKLCMRFACV